MDETKIFNKTEIDDALVASTIKEVCTALEEKGYDPINQVVGYLISEDPGYISNFKDARNKLTKIERTKIMETLLKEFIK
ncbi:MAG: IreB family regulatory phosphoprotein [Bacilli bacterium]